MQTVSGFRRGKRWPQRRLSTCSIDASLAKMKVSLKASLERNQAKNTGPVDAENVKSGLSHKMFNSVTERIFCTLFELLTS
ncbi:hypothetical protein M5689_012740 [Euphorbia peplus]|nr:hypothetical protein M5689_012740 [Euphorbia peplus]